MAWSYWTEARTGLVDLERVSRRVAEYNEATGALIREYVWMG